MGLNLMDPKEGDEGVRRDGISFILMQFAAKFLWNNRFLPQTQMLCPLLRTIPSYSSNFLSLPTAREGNGWEVCVILFGGGGYDVISCLVPCSFLGGVCLSKGRVCLQETPPHPRYNIQWWALDRVIHAYMHTTAFLFHTIRQKIF